MEIQKHPSIEEVSTFAIQSANSWMTPIMSFLQDGHLPQNTEEAKKVKKRATRFTILNDALYKTKKKLDTYWKKPMEEFAATTQALDPW